MSNTEKILKSLSNLIENGILTSNDIKNEISTDLKFVNILLLICDKFLYVDQVKNLYLQGLNL